MPHWKSPDREVLRADLARVRAATSALAEPLSPEDQVAQSMPDASPVKWHLAHTTWFFETFVLAPFLPGYAPFHPQFVVLFNSYYQGVGAAHPRPRRGLLTRPTVAEVLAYRNHVDAAMEDLFSTLSHARFHEVAGRIELGLHHEEQHQELILTDLKHLFAQNPLDPAYRRRLARTAPSAPSAPRAAAAAFTPPFAGGVHEIGATSDTFTFDNELPRHRVWTDAFELSERLVTAGEYLAFIDDGGYARHDLWLSEGWALARAEAWDAPLYWRKDDDGWSMMTLAGRRPVEPDEPVCHVSFYEADAYARWAGARLPREDEWEIAAERLGAGGRMAARRAHARSAGDAPHSAKTASLDIDPREGVFAEDALFHPAPAPHTPGLTQMLGDAWEWTASAYLPYPGFAPLPGALGEYNGKFMSGQMVLRGGSCATPRAHIRPTYRNFFPPSARWQFSGIRLARTAAA